MVVSSVVVYTHGGGGGNSLFFVILVVLGIGKQIRIKEPLVLVIWKKKSESMNHQF
jgi:hypothetical protein